MKIHIVNGFILKCLLLYFNSSLTLTISMSPEEYRSLIMSHCFNNTEYHVPLVLGQHKPVGLSIDYFVSLVHKVESKLPHLKTKDIVGLLLKRFHYDGIENMFSNEYFHQYVPQFQNRMESSRRVMNEKIFGKNIISKINHWKFPEEILTEDEKCAMFFMISHNINRTVNDQNNFAKEFGVVSLMNDDAFAFSLNPILLGILVALYNVEPFEFTLKTPQENSLLEIDPLLAVTLSDKLAISCIASLKNYDNRRFGSTGNWNSTYCQSEYRLKDYNDLNYIVTMADINGGVNGWLIGKKLKSESGQFLRNVKLSTLLDRYFSRDGLSIDSGICDANFSPTESISKISLNYAYYWNKYFENDNYEYNRISGYLEESSEIFKQQIGKSLEIRARECDRIISTHLVDNQYETKVDLFIMIDNNGYQYSKFHLEIVTRLLVKIKSINSLGKVSLIVNANRGFDSEAMSNYAKDLQVPLHLLAYDSSSIQMVTCRLAWYDYRETTIKSKKNLLNYLVQFFERANMTKMEKGHSRNLIWFSLKSDSYEKLTERERAFYYQSRWNILYNFNIRMFFVSSFEQNLDDDLSKMVLNQGDWFKVNPANDYDEILTDKLVQRLLQTPIPLRNDNCQTKLMEEKFFIAPNKKQSWVLYPKYFLNSRSVHLKFVSETDGINICLGRWLFPEQNITQCKERVSDQQNIEFTVDKPCRWNNIETCLPIYFTITRKTQYNSLPQSDKCTESECQSFDQTGWFLSLNGLTCAENYSSRFLLNFNLFLLIILINLFL